MSSLTQGDKKQWEEFVEKLSELEKKYQTVLHELDAAQSRLKALANSSTETEQYVARQTTPAAAERPATEVSTGQRKTGLLTKLKHELRSLQISPAKPVARRLLNPYVCCRRCGAKAMHATRFCVQCGADFGRRICSCGRDLVESDRFCDHCGRPLEETLQQATG